MLLTKYFLLFLGSGLDKTHEGTTLLSNSHLRAATRLDPELRARLEQPELLRSRMDPELRSRLEPDMRSRISTERRQLNGGLRHYDTSSFKVSTRYLPYLLIIRRQNLDS